MSLFCLILVSHSCFLVVAVWFLLFHLHSLIYLYLWIYTVSPVNSIMLILFSPCLTTSAFWLHGLLHLHLMLLLILLMSVCCSTFSFSIYFFSIPLLLLSVSLSEYFLIQHFNSFNESHFLLVAVLWLIICTLTSKKLQIYTNLISVTHKHYSCRAQGLFLFMRYCYTQYNYMLQATRI